MKKEKYRLDTVVRVRRQSRDDASRKVKACRERLDSENEELAKRKNALSDHRIAISKAKATMAAELDEGTSASVIVSHKGFIETLKMTEATLTEELEKQKKVVHSAEIALENALKLLTDASRELTVIEKHKKKWQNTELKRVNKKEQKLLDEISSILHERSKKL